MLAAERRLLFEVANLPRQSCMGRARGRALSALVAAASVSGWVAVARAQAPAEAAPAKEYVPCTRQPTETDIAGAKGAFQAGQVSFEEADYHRAIAYWEDAYRRDCTAHALLLNLARAYELNGTKEHAITALSTYLERVPDSPDQAKIQRRIEVLQRQLETERAAAAAEAAPRPSAAPNAQPAGGESPTPSPSGDVALEASTTSGAGKRPLLPLVVAGAGAAIAVVGVILYIPAYSDLQDVEDECPRHFCEGSGNSDLAERGNDLRTRVNIAGAMTIGGAVVLGGGLTWYFLSPRSGGSSAARPKLVPALAPSYAGLSYSGSF